MAVTLYTAPDCIRCKIVKKYFADKGVEYETVDFKGDADTFNKFYRANRKAIYRNPEGVEFPLFMEGEVIKQGSGEILAWLLGQGELEACVTRSDMLHGKISGLHPSACPAGQDENYIELVKRLAEGGLEVWLQTDGRKPDLLEKLLQIPNVHAICNIVGDENVTKQVYGGCPTKEELAKTIELVLASKDGRVRFLLMPVEENGQWIWQTPAQAEAGAKMVADACGKPAIKFSIETPPEDMPIDRHGLTTPESGDLIKYRSAIRKHLFKADVA